MAETTTFIPEDEQTQSAAVSSAEAIVRERGETEQLVFDQLEDRVNELRDLIEEIGLPLEVGSPEIQNNQLLIDVSRQTERTIGQSRLPQLQSVNERQFFQLIDRAMAATQDISKQQKIDDLRTKYAALVHFLRPQDPEQARQLYAELRREEAESDTGQFEIRGKEQPMTAADILAIAQGVLEPLWRKRQ